MLFFLAVSAFAFRLARAHARQVVGFECKFGARCECESLGTSAKMQLCSARVCQQTFTVYCFVYSAVAAASVSASASVGVDSSVACPRANNKSIANESEKAAERRGGPGEQKPHSSSSSSSIDDG